MLQALTRIPPTTLVKVVAQNALLAAAYFVVARVSLLFAYRDLQITAVWLPSGVALAAVLMLGRRVVPGILLGDFATGLSFGTAPAVAAVVAAGGALEAVIGARLLP
jgi:integral membrane sensor domain MASE1